MTEQNLKEKWNWLAMAGLVVSTVLISPVGIIVGALNLKYPGRKVQAYVLLILGIIMTILWIYHFYGHQGHDMHHEHHH